MEHIIEKFSDLTAKPVNYLEVQNDIKGDIKNLIKTLYDFTKTEEKNRKKSKGGALQELIIEGLDEEQIWQQIDLQNAECWDHLVWEVANCISNKNDLSFPVEIPELENEAEDEEMQEIEEENSEPEKEVVSFPSKSKTDTTNQAKKERNIYKKSSIVDDQFFKLQEMEQFLLNEEKIEEKGKKKDDDEESIDLFEDIEDAESEAEDDMMYKDFFNDDSYDGEENIKYDETSQNSDLDDQDMPDKDIGSELDNDCANNITKKSDKKVRFSGLQPDSDSESDSDDSNTEANNTIIVNKDEKKSEFELRQERLKQHISRLEEKSIKDAPWQLKGEVDATKRPQNSLLQEVVDFDLTTRPAPIITEQTTVTLEGLIRQRIKDKAWDDVEKKEKPVDDQLAFKKPEILDHSKSKLSLAQVYEAEYLKQKQAASGETQEDEPENHKEIRDKMSKLFAKLDALCHYHYTPKAPQAEVKIVSNTPAISMEEVAPVTTSDATLLAPEEVKKKHKGDIMSKEERTQTDKNRERRKKKKFQKQKGQVMKVTDNRNTKIGVEANDKSIKTSKAFFQQLNDDATSLIKKNKNKNK